MKFTKMHGCGNDYIYVEEHEVEGLDDNGISRLARRMSDRKHGVGSDGLIIIAGSDIADVRMIMYNSDGSRGKMCGNGIRCLCKYVYERKQVIKTKFRVETDSGVKEVSLKCNGGTVTGVKVNMGKYVNEKKKSYTLDGRKYDITYVEVGNPHAVIWVPDLERTLVEKVGSYLEYHEDFPDRVNTEFVQYIGKNTIALRVWERGSGETLACGTGACAAYVAGRLAGILGDEVTVNMTGGSVVVSYDSTRDNILLYGDANEVFTGEY